jgi:ribosome biogenesis GTPase
MTVEATVIRTTGSWYEVRDEAAAVWQARIRGRLRLGGRRSTSPVVVGDRVMCSLEDGGEVWIEEILPRTNYIIRRASNLSKESHIIAANIDQALIVATLFSPTTSPEFIDRFLVTSEAYRIPATILLNKIDLSGQFPEAVEHFIAIYRQASYRVICASAVTGRGIDELEEYLRGRTTLVSGNSGVGKSTLIKTIEPALDIRIGGISRSHHKGMHTTTFSQMYSLSTGGYIIDTPGIKGFGLIDIDPAELAHYYPDFRRFAPDCQYYNCTHVHEPGCAVLRAVEEGKISEERYISYLKMLEEDEKYR